MKYFFSLVLFLLTSFYLEAKTVVYPQLDAVINQLYNNYVIPESTTERTIHFAKKPDGWFIQWEDRTKFPYSIVEEELFWSVKKKKFLPLKKIQSGKTALSDNQKYKLVSYSDRYSYSRIQYFGYTGWEKDVVHDYGNKK